MHKKNAEALKHSPRLTFNVLWNIIDHLDAAEGWQHWLLKYDTDRVRPLVVEQALQEVGLSCLLRIVADCYRFQIA